MSWLDFFASLFKSLTSIAWPSAFAFSVWLFKDQLSNLLPRLTVQRGEFIASFRLDKAEAEAKELPQPPSESPPETVEEKTRFEQIAQISPRAAILEERNNLEDALTMTAAAAQIDITRSYGINSIIRELRRRDVITPSLGSLLDDLRAIGNEAAHGRRVGFVLSDAQRFKDLAETATAELDRIRSKLETSLRTSLNAKTK